MQSICYTDSPEGQVAGLNSVGGFNKLVNHPDQPIQTLLFSGQLVIKNGFIFGVEVT